MYTWGQEAKRHNGTDELTKEIRWVRELWFIMELLFYTHPCPSASFIMRHGVKKVLANDRGGYVKVMKD